MRPPVLTWMLPFLLIPCLAGAHAGHPAGPILWTFDAWVVLPLLLTVALYATGTAALWRRAGMGRGIRPWQVICYGAGWLALAGALVSPLHWLGEQVFTAHMVEHEVVMAVAAPLLAVSRPIGAVLWAIPPALRSGLARLSRTALLRAGWARLTSPLPATIGHGVVIWAWHAPLLFDAAVANAGLHRLQHVCFLLSALAFWWGLIRRCDPGTAVACLFITMIHTTILGALLAVAPHVLFLRQTAGAQRFGLTALQDQQLAGLVMWVPAGTVYAGAALVFAALWVHRSGQRWRRQHALPL